jgi:hypothetical protein
MTGTSHSEKAQDKTIEDSFPASDPPASGSTTGPGRTSDAPSSERDQDAIPTGYPTADRHAAETAHQWEDEEKGIDAARDLSSDEAEEKTQSSSRP